MKKLVMILALLVMITTAAAIEPADWLSPDQYY